MRPWYSPIAGLAVLFAQHAIAGGIQGYGLHQYDPLCAESCLRSLTSLSLSCTEHSGGDGHSMMMMMTTSPACRASDTAFLTSVAWCISDKCAGLEVSKLEAYWEGWVTGSKDVVPKWTYSEALAEVHPRPPKYLIASTDMSLNVTSVVNPMTYLMQWNVLGNVLNEENLESTYGIVLISVAVGFPVLMTWLRYMPFMPALYDRLKSYILYPSTLGTYSVRPLPFQLGNAPTVGQGLFVAIFVILNLVLTAVSYRTAQPNAWYTSTRQEIIAYLLYRTGSFAFTLLPVLLLFSSRNNILMWIANWSHPTYLLLHRWVGRLFILHAVLHSIFGLVAYKRYENTVWWAWGAVATVFSVVLGVSSGLYVRRKNYEIFLLMHIILSVLVIVGCWYHLVLWYESMGMHVPSYTSGYEVWLYIAFAVWAFDRVVRVGRLLRAGIKRSKVTELGNDYVRVDMRDIQCSLEPGKHVYAYFPALSFWRPWENHPFSVIPTVLLQTQEASVASSPLPGSSGKQDLESMTQNKVQQVFPSSENKTTATGLTLIIKKSKGITKYLQPDDSLLTLVEGPYSSSHLDQILCCDRVLLVGGGIGITSLLPWIRSHWNVKLAWSVKNSAHPLVDVLEPCISTLDQAQRDVRVGSRLDVAALINEEVAAGWGRVGVVVSGPGPLCDDVRAKVTAAGRASKTVFELEVDAYSW